MGGRGFGPEHVRAMATIDVLAADFLAQQTIAVAGVSPKRQTTANLIVRALRKKGKRVFAIGSEGAVEGERTWPDLASLPQVPDGLLIVTRAALSESLVRQCVTAGVRRVWLHNMLGTKPRFMKAVAAKLGSTSDAAVALCRANGITVIPGSCPMQFLGDVPHTCMRGILRMTGALEV